MTATTSPLDEEAVLAAVIGILELVTRRKQPAAGMGTALYDIDGLDSLRLLETVALAEEEQLESQQPSEDLLALEGMDTETARALAAHGIRTSEDLSELGADEVVEFGIDGLDEERAAALILAARAEEIARLERGE